MVAALMIPGPTPMIETAATDAVERLGIAAAVTTSIEGGAQASAKGGTRSAPASPVVVGRHREGRQVRRIAPMTYVASIPPAQMPRPPRRLGSPRRTRPASHRGR
jgi:hypothetical protein